MYSNISQILLLYKLWRYYNQLTLRNHRGYITGVSKYHNVSCIVVLIVFFVIVQSSGLTSVWFREKMTFFLNLISFHIFPIYVGGACWGLPAACRLIAVCGARLPSVDGLTVRYIKNAPLLNLPSKYVCDLFQTCFRYMYVWYKHTGTLRLCLHVALSFIWLD